MKVIIYMWLIGVCFSVSYCDYFFFFLVVSKNRERVVNENGGKIIYIWISLYLF